MGMIGAFGVAVSGVQLAVLERRELSTMHWSGPIVLCLLGFAASLFCMYVLTALFMSRCDATAFNLSMLTSDAWALLFGVVLFHQRLGWLYFVAAAIVVSGIIVYNSAPSPTVLPPAAAAGTPTGDTSPCLPPPSSPSPAAAGTKGHDVAGTTSLLCGTDAVDVSPLLEPPASVNRV